MLKSLQSPVASRFIGTLIICFLLAPNWVGADCQCGPLPDPPAGETVVTVSDTASLQDEIDNAAGPKTIYLADGVYPVTASSWVTVTRPDITIRSASGNREDVIIQGPGMDASWGFGIQVYDSRVTIADLTIRDVGCHAIQVNKTAGRQTDDLLFHNLLCIDTGQQVFKSSGGDMYRGTIQCSVFQYTNTLDQGDYTNGIDIVGTHEWIIRDNLIRNIKAASGLAGPAILVWPAGTGILCSDTIVERNRVIDCDMGIFFGNPSAGGLQHTGGVIRNNFIKGYSGSDAGIGLVRSDNAVVANNTIYSPGGAVNWSIETRYAESQNNLLINNLCDEIIWDRNDAASTRTTNHTQVTADDFVNAADGDLHLADSASGSIIDGGTAHTTRGADIDNGGPEGSGVDIGADEYGSNSPGAPVIVDPGQASQISQHAAVLTATFETNGLTTTYWFEYETGDITDAATQSAQAPPGSAMFQARGDLSDLVPGSVYHYKVVARNCAGTVYGEIQQFTTTAADSNTGEPEIPNSGQETPSGDSEAGGCFIQAIVGHVQLK